MSLWFQTPQVGGAGLVILMSASTRLSNQQQEPWDPSSP